MTGDALAEASTEEEEGDSGCIADGRIRTDLALAPLLCGQAKQTKEEGEQKNQTRMAARRSLKPGGSLDEYKDANCTHDFFEFGDLTDRGSQQ